MVEHWSPREVLALVEGLPDTGLFAARLAGGEQWREYIGWGKERHMAADVWDLLVAINTPKGKKPSKYPRPEAKKRPPEGVPLMQMFSGLSKRKGE